MDVIQQRKKRRTSDRSFHDQRSVRVDRVDVGLCVGVCVGPMCVGAYLCAVGDDDGEEIGNKRRCLSSEEDEEEGNRRRGRGDGMESFC